MEEEYINGARIRIARRARKLSQKTLSEKLGISQTAVSYMEDGRWRGGEELLNKLIYVLGVTEAWLRGESDEGGVPINPGDDLIRINERDKISIRWVKSYERLKLLGIIESDSSFADTNGISRSSLSTALSGRNPIPDDWVPAIEQYGARREFIYNNKLPMFIANRVKKFSSTEEAYRDIKALIINIEEDTKLLKDLFSQIVP